MSVQNDMGMGMALDLEDAVHRLLTYLNTSTADLSPDATMYSFPNMTLRDGLALATDYLNVIKNNSAIITDVLEMVSLLSHELKASR